MSVKVSPSILAADFANLSLECSKIDKSNADWFHLDVMDGLFVPNISFGMPVVKTIRQLTKKPLDVHLMIVEPEKYITEFINLGSDIITVHIEATNNLNQIINKIHESSLKAGIAINPETPISELKEYIKKVDLICLMGVNPGFAGQKFIESTTERLKELKQLIISSESYLRTFSRKLLIMMSVISFFKPSFSPYSKKKLCLFGYKFFTWKVLIIIIF